MVQGKKLHDLPHSHLKPEFLSNGPGLFPGNPGDLRQPFRLPLHHRQSLISKMLHDPRRHPGADALDGPAGQVIQNFHGGLGHEPLQKFRLKLTAVAGMVAPLARDHQPLAHGRQRNGAHHRHRLTAAHIQPQDRIAVLIILVHHGADRALDDLHFLFHKKRSLSRFRPSEFPGALMSINIFIHFTSLFAN